MNAHVLRQTSTIVLHLASPQPQRLATPIEIHCNHEVAPDPICAKNLVCSISAAGELTHTHIGVILLCAILVALFTAFFAIRVNDAMLSIYLGAFAAIELLVSGGASRKERSKKAVPTSEHCVTESDNQPTPHDITGAPRVAIAKAHVKGHNVPKVREAHVGRPDRDNEGCVKFRGSRTSPNVKNSSHASSCKHTT